MHKLRNGCALALWSNPVRIRYGPAAVRNLVPESVTPPFRLMPFLLTSDEELCANLFLRICLLTAPYGAVFLFAMWVRGALTNFTKLMKGDYE